MIVGLAGKMGAGKNEAAKRLALLSSLPVVEISFARKLKQSAAALLGCSVDDLERWKNNPDVQVGFGVVGDFHGTRWGGQFPSQTVRSFLQRYGTESHRDVFGQDFWIDAALPLRGTHSPAPLRSVDTEYKRALYIVTDMRFPNEMERVKKLGGATVRIIGPETDTGSHPSEQVLDCYYEIDNSVRDDGYAALDYALAELLDKLGVGALAVKPQ